MADKQNFTVQLNSQLSKEKCEISIEKNEQFSYNSMVNSFNKNNNQQYGNKSSLNCINTNNISIDSTQRKVNGTFKSSYYSIKSERIQIQKQFEKEKGPLQELSANIEGKLSTKQNLHHNLKSYNSLFLKIQKISNQTSIIQQPFSLETLEGSRQKKFYDQSSQSNCQNILDNEMLNQTKNAQKQMKQKKQFEKLLQKSLNSTITEEKTISNQESSFLQEEKFIKKYINQSIKEQHQETIFQSEKQEKSFEKQNQQFPVQSQEHTQNLQRQLFLAKLQLDMAHFQSDLFQFKAAQQNFIQSLKSMQKAKSRLSNQYAKILDQMGFFYIRRQLNQLSNKCFKESISIKRALGNQKGLAQTLMFLGTNLGSLQLLNQSLKLSNKFYHSQRIAKIYNNMGNVYRFKGNLKQALQFYQQSITMKQQFYGKDDPNVANTLINVGISYYKLSNFDQGLASLKRALNIFQKDPEKNYYSIGETKTTIGAILNAKGQYEQALKILKEALQLRSSRLSPDDIKCAYTLNHMGMVYYNVQNFQQSLKCFNQALRIHNIKKKRNEDTHYKASVLSNMGLLKLAMGEFNEADKFLSDSLTIKNPDQDLITYATALNNRGNYFREIGQYERAQQYYREELNMLKEKNLQNLVQNAQLYYDMALLLKMKNNLIESREYAQKSLQIRINRCGQNHPDTLKSKLLLEEIEKSLILIKM